VCTGALVAYTMTRREERDATACVNRHQASVLATVLRRANSRVALPLAPVEAVGAPEADHSGEQGLTLCPLFSATSSQHVSCFVLSSIRKPPLPMQTQKAARRIRVVALDR